MLHIRWYSGAAGASRSRLGEANRTHATFAFGVDGGKKNMCASVAVLGVLSAALRACRQWLVRLNAAFAATVHSSAPLLNPKTCWCSTRVAYFAVFW